MLVCFCVLVYALKSRYVNLLCVVVEARDKQGGVAKVVESWGTPDSSQCILAASINDRKRDPV